MKRRLAVLLILAQLLSLTGCTRRFFRWRTDAEVDEILCEKDKYPQWKLAQFYVYPDPRSRFADWTNWDRPPRPPDDPAAYKLSPNPQPTPLNGIQYIEGTGYLDMLKAFNERNRARRAAEREEEARREQREGPEPVLPGQTKTAAELDREIEESIDRELALATTLTDAIAEDKQPRTPASCQMPPYLIDYYQSIQLAFINSREFQTIREQIYLAALPVTVERMAFAAQPFFFGNFFREKSGAQSADGMQNRWVANTTAGFTKYFSTGGLLLLNFANQTVYNLGHAPSPTSVSNISLDFIQPFLAGAGRAIALEPLTQAERNLLYAIRDFLQYRREYYAWFAAGQAAFIPGVQAGVIAFQPTTILFPGAFIPGATAPPAPALTGLNAAAVQVNTGSVNQLAPNAGLAPTAQGYLATITERAQLVNFYKNIQSLRRFLNLFEVYLEGNLVTLVQKGLIEQSLLNSISTILGTQVNYRVSLDQLKQQFGLPMTITLDLDDTPLRPMIDLTNRYEELSFSVNRAAFGADQLGRKADYRQARAGFDRLMRTTPLLKGSRAQEDILRRLKQLRDTAGTEKDRIAFLAGERQRLLRQRDQMRERQRKLKGEPFSAEEQRQFQDLLFTIDLVEFELALSIYERGEWLDIKAADPQERLRLEYALWLAQWRALKRTFLGMADYAFGEKQAAIKRAWPSLPAICADGVDVLNSSEGDALGAVMRTTLANRPDLMNVRAQLVDSWRKIRVAANALMGTFNVDYHMDSGTPSNNPFGFGGGFARRELIFNYSLPLVRIVQRNNYRSTLIAYQQQRRQVMIREDQALFDVRFDLRQVRAAANNIHLVQKRNIELAFMQVDQALAAFDQPQAPPGADPTGLIGPVAARPIAGDPAALTQQLLNTQANLLNARNILYSTWTGYLTQRINIYRDMGIMQLDATGLWDKFQDDRSCQPPTDCTSDGQQPSSQPGQQPPGGQPEELPAPRTQPERLPEPRPLEASAAQEVEPPQ
jgi:hypothetical protein